MLTSKKRRGAATSSFFSHDATTIVFYIFVFYKYSVLKNEPISNDERVDERSENALNKMLKMAKGI